MHIFVFLCLSFLFGCFCGIKFATVNICYCVAIFTVVFIIKLILFEKKTLCNFKTLGLIVIFCAGALLGIFHDRNTFKDVMPLYGREITVEGTVIQTDGDMYLIDTDYGLLRGYCYTGDYAKRYDVVEVTGELCAYNTAQYNGGFDARLYNVLQGVVGYIECTDIEIVGYDQRLSVWDTGGAVRECIKNKVDNFPADHKVRGFITALLTGDTDDLDSGVREAFRLTGISHLIAVSGLHVGIFISFFWIFSNRLRKNKVLHIMFILTLVIMYTLVIGERASVFRAAIMVVCSYIIFNMKHRSDSLSNLMIAGLLICFVNPYYVTDAGFQMSFLATLGIILFSEYFKISVIAVPAIATLFLLPVTVYYSNTISTETVIVNLITVPLVPSIIFFGYVGCFVPIFGSIACVIANFLISVAEYFASMDFLHISVPSPNAMHFLIWFLIVCIVYNMLNKNNGTLILTLTLVTLFLCENVTPYYDVPQYAHRLRFINSGKYNMMHITTENDFEILTDCGIYADDYALKNGIDAFYMVIITNNDRKRYEGLETLCANKTVHNILLPDTMENNKLKLENSKVLYYNQNDYDFTIDGVRFKFMDKNGERCLLLKLHGEELAYPFGTEIADIGHYNIMCVPDKCTDCDVAMLGNRAEYYIHPTYRYKYYDFGHKYIVPQEGMIEMLFFEKEGTVIRR